jgi:hypothetical protein
VTELLKCSEYLFAQVDLKIWRNTTLYQFKVIPHKYSREHLVIGFQFPQVASNTWGLSTTVEIINLAKRLFWRDPCKREEPEKWLVR